MVIWEAYGVVNSMKFSLFLLAVPLSGQFCSHKEFRSSQTSRRIYMTNNQW